MKFSNKNDYKSDYKILFIGGVYEEGKEKMYLAKSKNGIQNAVNTHQWNFIKGIEANNKNPIDILSARYVDVYPNYSDIYVKKNKWNHAEGANDENIGFINIKILKNIERKIKLGYKAKKWARSDNCTKTIICYYPSIPQMEATIKSKNKNIKTLLIVPDIPQFMDLREKKINIFSEKIQKRQQELVKQFDGYILLTKDMAKALEIENKPYIVIEGIVNIKDQDVIAEKKDNDKKRIVYTGSLHKKYGIENYIKAIKLIEDRDIEFYIFGSGEMQNEIIELSKEDSRIKFMGYKDRKEVLKYQREATLLINPRSINEDFVKYSFPSKLIEYMLSGTPVLTTKLPCIPEEYFSHLFFIEDVSPEKIKEAIMNSVYLKQEILNNKAEEAKKFVIENKNYAIQGEKIINLISKINAGGN